MPPCNATILFSSKEVVNHGEIMKIVTIVVLKDVDHCNVHKDCNIYNEEEDISCEELTNTLIYPAQVYQVSRELSGNI